MLLHLIYSVFQECFHLQILSRKISRSLVRLVIGTQYRLWLMHFALDIYLTLFPPKAARPSSMDVSFPRCSPLYSTGLTPLTLACRSKAHQWRLQVQRIMDHLARYTSPHSDATPIFRNIDKPAVGCSMINQAAPGLVPVNCEG